MKRYVKEFAMSCEKQLESIVINNVYPVTRAKASETIDIIDAILQYRNNDMITDYEAVMEITEAVDDFRSVME